MKKILLYSCFLLLFTTACEQSFDENNEMIPVAGMWASVDENETVTSYIEFEAGVFSSYTLKGEKRAFLADESLWGIAKGDFYVQTAKPYSITNGCVYFYGGDLGSTISLSDNGALLNFGKERYHKFTSFHTAPYRQISVLYKGNVIEGECVIEIGDEGALVEFEYSINNAETGVKPTVKSEASWIEQIKVENDKISFRVLDNKLFEYRQAVLLLSYPLAEDVILYIKQGHAPRINVEETAINVGYQSEVVTISYSLQDPYPGEELEVSTQATWITDITIYSNKITANVGENLFTQDRSAILILSCLGAPDVEIKINQESRNPTIIIGGDSVLNMDNNSFYWAIGYSIQEPFPEETLRAECAASWVSEIDVRENENTIRFRVAENTSSSDRSAYLVLSYKGAEDVLITINQSGTQSSKPVIYVWGMPDATTDEFVAFLVWAPDANAYKAEYLCNCVEEWESMINVGYTIEELMNLYATPFANSYLEEINTSGSGVGFLSQPNEILRLAVRIWDEKGVMSDIVTAEMQAKSN